jgi:two-component system NtrC family sensor kinase
MKAVVSDTLEGIERIKSLVKGMLDYARPSAPSLTIDSVVRVLKNSISLMDSQLKKKNIKVLLNLAEDMPEVVIDCHQIQQVFINLLINAMEAMPDGGTITVRGVIEKDRKLSAERLMLHFSDSGTGISDENLPRIFDPFFTTKAEGTGLGLSIVQKILSQHDASVDVFSNGKTGATFILGFPIRPGEGK